MKTRRANSYAIYVYVLMTVVFSIVWAIFCFGVFPHYVTYQTNNFPSGVYDPNQLAFMNALVYTFPMIILWGGAFWMWDRSQRKRGAEDIPV